MKKLIWLFVLVLIVAVVLISVFAVQRDSLTTKVNQLETDNADLTRQLDDVDLAVKTAQELADSMVKEAEDKLTTVTKERDALQASADTAAQQLTAGVAQVKSALAALGVEDTEAQLSAQLTETQAALIVMTQQRDQLAQDVENAKIASVKVTVINDQNETVEELDKVEELNLSDLPAGAYTVQVSVLNAAGEEAASYAFPYVSAKAEEAPAEEAPVEEAPVEEAPVEEASAEEAPAEEAPAEEAPAEGAEEAADKPQEPAEEAAEQVTEEIPQEGVEESQPAA